MTQYYEYKEYKIKIEYFNLEDIIKIEVELIDTNEKYCKTICSRDIELPVKKFNTILTNGLELKPNYFVEFSKLTHQSKNKLEIKVRLNYDDLVDITESIYLDEYKAYQNDFETRINELEEKINTKIEEVEIFYKKHIETLVQTNKVLKEQIESLNNIVHNIDKQLFIKIDKNFIINKNIDLIDLDYENDRCSTQKGSFGFHIKKLNQFGTYNIERFYFPVFIEGCESEFYKNISNYLDLNIKKIIVSKIFNNYYNEVEIFINLYLTNRNDFIVDEIEIYDNRLIDTLIKHSNYKKLVIKQDNNFNDNKIKAHCKSNNIEFEYII